MAERSKEQGGGSGMSEKKPSGTRRASVLNAVPGLRKVPPVAGYIRTHRPHSDGVPDKLWQAPVSAESSTSFVEKEFSETSLLEIDDIFAKAQLAVSEKAYMGNYQDQLIMAREALRKVQIGAKLRAGRIGVQKDGDKQVQVGLFEGRKRDFAEIMLALGIREGVSDSHSGERVKSDVVKIGETSDIQTFYMHGAYGKTIEYEVMETPYVSFDIFFPPEVLAVIAQSEMLPPLPVKKIVNNPEVNSPKLVLSR